MKRMFLFPVVLGLAACGGERADAERAAELSTGGDAQRAHALLCVLNTQLRPENEVLPATDPVLDSIAKGHAQIKVFTHGAAALVEFDVFILNKGGEEFSAGHIHEAQPGVAGDVVVPLVVGQSLDDVHIRLSGTVTGVALGLAEDVCSEPGEFYVNFHTALDPGGAVRGQLD